MNKRVEEILKERPELREWYARQPPVITRKPKPKPAIVAMVSEKFAEAVKANPESVRLSAKAADETVVVDRPRRTEAIQVLEVDAEGRPALARRHDLATNEKHLVEFEGGYRRTGVVSDYNPMDALKRGDE